MREIIAAIWEKDGINHIKITGWDTNVKYLDSEHIQDDKDTNTSY